MKLSGNLVLKISAWKMGVGTCGSVNGTTMDALEIGPHAAMIGVGMRF